ncbi:MAG: uroporphyrinogen-III C-methyltransferase [Planctomycetota bacterium]
MTNKVYLVGAGPGDPGLITVKGAEALARADAVVYDFLANRALLALAKPGAETHFVGKQAGYHSLPQEEINALLIKLWRAGNTVVRLKGGDPFVFGRGGEEALELSGAGIPYEVIPGVTAGLAGLAYAGIPATHRGVSVSATLVTGHENPDKEVSDLDWKSLALPHGTLIVYMGVRNLPHITKELIAGGLDADTPAALVRMATFAEQQVIVSTVGRISEEAAAAKIRPPALLCVGKVVELREKLNWFESLPLFGRKIVITRPKEQCEQQRKALETLGAQVVEHPAIRIEPPDDFSELDASIRNLSGFDFIIFTSTNAVDQFMGRVATLGLDARALAGCCIGVVGPGTKRALETHGLRPDLMPERFTSAMLIPAMLQKFPDARGRKALLPRADIAPENLLVELNKVGILPTEVMAYRTRPAEGDAAVLQKAIEDHEIHGVTFASSSSVQNFVTTMGSDFLRRHREELVFVSIGPATTATIKELGFTPDAEAVEHTIPGMTRALLDLFAR